MNRDAILKLLDEERRALARDGEVLETVVPVTRLRSAANLWHTVIHSSLTTENADAVIVREIEHHRQLGARFEWKVYGHDQPGDLLDRLRCHGLDIDPCEAFVVHELATWKTEAPSHRICLVENLEQVEIFRRTASEIFKKEYQLTASELAAAIESGSTQHRGYIAYVGDEPAGVGRLYTHPRSVFGGLFGGGTRAAYRSRGVYRALVAARAQDALKLGARYLSVDALPTSQPILKRMGFERITDIWACIWRPSKS
jgi:GNAT superfamily N-acetyltransferase